MSKIEVPPAEILVFYGPMFSGKTAAMAAALSIEQEVLQRKVQAFKPIIDDRGEGLAKIRSKNGLEFPATPIHSPEEILEKLYEGVQMVGIDEGQFLASGIVAVVRELAQGRGIKVAIAGLPTDFRGEPFGMMPILLAIAQKRIEFKAICTHRDGSDGDICGNDATQTQRLIDGKPAKYDDPIVLVGADNCYEARCFRHHFVPR